MMEIMHEVAFIDYNVEHSKLHPMLRTQSYEYDLIMQPMLC